MLKIRLLLCSLWLVGRLALHPTGAHAQIQLTLFNPAQAGVQGTQLLYQGDVTNTSNAPVFLTSANFTLGGVGLSLDDSPFLLNAPASLEPNASWSGTLFTVDIAADAPSSQLGTGTFTIVGGPNEGDQNALATARFSAAVAPEPSSGLLMGGLLAMSAAGGVLSCRHRRD